MYALIHSMNLPTVSPPWLSSRSAVRNKLPPLALPGTTKTKQNQVAPEKSADDEASSSKSKHTSKRLRDVNIQQDAREELAPVESPNYALEKDLLP